MRFLDNKPLQLSTTLNSLNIRLILFNVESDLIRLLNNLSEIAELKMQRFGLFGIGSDGLFSNYIMALKQLRYLNLHSFNLTLNTGMVTEQMAFKDQKQFSNLEWFQCIYCEFSREFIIYFESIFPSVTLLRLETWTGSFYSVAELYY